MKILVKTLSKSTSSVVFVVICLFISSFVYLEDQQIIEDENSSLPHPRFSNTSMVRMSQMPSSSHVSPMNINSGTLSLPSAMSGSVPVNATTGFPPLICNHLLPNDVTGGQQQQELRQRNMNYALNSGFSTSDQSTTLINPSSNLRQLSTASMETFGVS